MTKAEAGVEPSMDEILTSIRKIIAEDEVDQAPEVVAPGKPDVDDDDIVELTEDDEAAATEMLEPDLVAEDEAPADEPLETAHDLGVEEADALVVEAADHPDDPVDVEIAFDAAEPVADVATADVVDEVADVADEEVPAPEAASRPAEEPVPAEALIDAGTTTAAAGALQRLSTAMAPGDAVPGGDRSIEAFLADLLKPELKVWLDQHLAGLVERIVEREIKKLVRDAQPE